MSHYHFIGIGGVGMGALAALLLEKGVSVSGSDLRNNAMVQKLRDKGARIHEEHHEDNVNGADYVVYSSAIKKENPELRCAESKGVRILQRAELLAQLMLEQTSITVAGAHGKTTTSSMVTHLLASAGLRPTAAIGGTVMGNSSQSHLGSGKYFTAEVDESDGSFLNFFPDISVITNIDMEHLDHYGHWENILKAYNQFISQTKEQGVVIICGDDENLKDLAMQNKRTVLTYGFSDMNNVSAVSLQFDGWKSRFHCTYKGETIKNFELCVPGRHNVTNALAAISVGRVLDIDFDTIRNSLQSFQGVQRRFQLKGVFNQVSIVDDYAHHPTEITSVLDAAKSINIDGKLVVVFQPHRYTRVKTLLDDFAYSLANCDHLIVTDIYAASEQPIEGIDAERLCHLVAKISSIPVEYVKKSKIAGHVRSLAKPGDVVMTLGAGDIVHVAEELCEILKTKPQGIRID